MFRWSSRKSDARRGGSRCQDCNWISCPYARINLAQSKKLSIYLLLTVGNCSHHCYCSALTQEKTRRLDSILLTPLVVQKCPNKGWELVVWQREERKVETVELREHNPNIRRGRCINDRRARWSGRPLMGSTHLTLWQRVLSGVLRKLCRGL